MLSPRPELFRETYADEEKGIELDYDHRLSEELLKVHPPRLSDEMIPSGFIVFDGTIELGPHPNQIAIVALQYQEYPQQQSSDELGVLVTIYLDPSISGYLHPDYYGYVAIVNIPIWPYDWTFEKYLSRVDTASIMGGPRYVDRIPNLLLFNWCHGFLYSFLHYLRERTNVIHHPDNTKKVQAHARKLNLEPKINIVLWRKDTDHAPKDPDHVPGQIDWQCRWPIKEHKRTYHRGKANEFTITIKSYIKGPEDKPLKLPNVTINAAVR